MSASFCSNKAEAVSHVQQMSVTALRRSLLRRYPWWSGTLGNWSVAHAPVPASTKAAADPRTLPRAPLRGPPALGAYRSGDSSYSTFRPDLSAAKERRRAMEEARKKGLSWLDVGRAEIEPMEPPPAPPKPTVEVGLRPFSATRAAPPSPPPPPVMAAMAASSSNNVSAWRNGQQLVGAATRPMSLVNGGGRIPIAASSVVGNNGMAGSAAVASVASHEGPHGSDHPDLPPAPIWSTPAPYQGVIAGEAASFGATSYGDGEGMDLGPAADFGGAPTPSSGGSGRKTPAAKGAGRPRKATGKAAAASAAAPVEAEPAPPAPPPPPPPPPAPFPADVFCVETASQAQRVAAYLHGLAREGRVFGCDTEVCDIDVKTQTPVSHGRVVCFSVYCGEDVHFGLEKPQNGNGTPVTQSSLWVDLDGPEGDAILEAFRPFFEDPLYRKVWHNYGFDRHVLEKMGLRMAGFAGDTMHMARMFDSARALRGGYSLASLTSDQVLMCIAKIDLKPKIGMKDLFAVPVPRKDGTPGKTVVLPPIEEIQRNPATRGTWVEYSAGDAKSTWDLHRGLQTRLSYERTTDEKGRHELDMIARPGEVAIGELYSGCRTLLDVYETFWRPFGELLTGLERQGFLVDLHHLREAEAKAREDQRKAEAFFRAWVSRYVPAAARMNVSSGPQVQTLLFGGYPGGKDGVGAVEMEREFKAPNTEGFIEEGQKKPKKDITLRLHSIWGEGEVSRVKPEVLTDKGSPAVSTPVLRAMAGKPGAAQKALQELLKAEGKELEDGVLGLGLDLDLAEGDEEGSVLLGGEGGEALEEAEGGGKGGGRKKRAGSPEPAAAPKPRGVSDAELAALKSEAKSKGYGELYAAFGGGKAGLEACAALDALCDVNAVDTLLSSFILPLQSTDVGQRHPVLPDKYSRVHCSLNLNTETGRLSARRPNLQNQPALEKDRYKIRKAFTADRTKGHTLIVADYGQLELRILAHMSQCKSMIRAFELGGDFHSRTALTMYDYIQRDIEAGTCRLEAEGGDKDGVPLLKDKYAAERRKAKILNFSLAYGKTVFGLAKDFKTSEQEAQDTLNKWYSDRPEVKAWQEFMRAEAKEKGYVYTILGRRRHLQDIRSKDRRKRSHAERAAINTPIQGSGADVASAAMLEIASNERLRELGWRLVMQVHDEVIMEGPEESAAEAQKLVVFCMEHPFRGTNPLLVDLSVDSDVAHTWYEAK